MTEFQKILVELLLKALLVGAILSIILGMYKSFTSNMIKTSEENRIKLENMRKEQEEKNRQRAEEKRMDSKQQIQFNQVMCWIDQDGKKYYTNTVPATNKFIKPCPESR